MADIQETSSSPSNYWAITSLVLGLFGFLFALTAPIPFIPLISILTWPLGLGALVFGWAAGRLAKAGGGSAVAQTWWGVRLGCLGWIIQLTTSMIKMLLLAGLLAYLLTTFATNLIQPQPTAIP